LYNNVLNPKKQNGDSTQDSAYSLTVLLLRVGIVARIADTHLRPGKGAEEAFVGKVIL
jgi:hypothetical protein